MELVLAGILFIIAGGIAALCCNQFSRPASYLGIGSLVLGSLLVLIPVFQVMSGGASLYMQRPWPMPFVVSFTVGLDALSAFFLLPILIISCLCAVYGYGYMKHYWARKTVGWHWFFFNILVAGMAMLVIARNGVLFLLSWEVMSLAPFFLIIFLDDREKVRRAGWTYMVAAHLGAVFLLVLFMLMAQEAGSMDFAQFQLHPLSASGQLNTLFLLALIGFGTKAGFIPFHVWLPEAHPAAPSHVSALMSGVMIKMGIYGLVRILCFLGTPPLWWGVLLLLIGLCSGISGVLFAIAQHDLKRLLAYHSVENIGIIALGLGAGLIGINRDLPVLATLAFAGGLLHVINHSVFKSLLFMAAGSVQHASGTLEIDELGGLGKRMPWTAVTFVIGAAAICGLPPFNGFVSEFLIYLASYHGGILISGASAASLLAGIAGLALIGGLAAACFAKAFGVVFLGEPRSVKAGECREAPVSMRSPMVLLAASCLLIGLSGPFLVRSMALVLREVVPFTPLIISRALSQADFPLSFIVAGGVSLFVLFVLLALLHRILLSGRQVTSASTWGCGYLKPSARMQYTASSFGQPITNFFAPVLRTRTTLYGPSGIFPRKVSLSTSTPDIFMTGIYSPLFLACEWLLSKLRWLQHGRVQLYIMYIVITIIAVMIWMMGGFAQ